MDKNLRKDINFTLIDGAKVYIGPERRTERRRRRQNERIETLIRNFGLDRRLRVERRRNDTSWLLTSLNVINE